MKITLFTGNQPRHRAMISMLSRYCDELAVVMECTTLFPGKQKDFFNNSKLMMQYLDLMQRSEKQVFGSLGEFTPSNARILPMRMGDLKNMTLLDLQGLRASKYYVVFGSSFIKGDLLKFLTKRDAINIHMGISPFYRGSSCNFWAMYDNRPDLVGATIHYLSETLDGGDIICHAKPTPHLASPFDYGMRCVEAAQETLENLIIHEDIRPRKGVPQTPEIGDEIRYTRNADFTDEVVKHYLKCMPPMNDFYKALKRAAVPLSKHVPLFLVPPNLDSDL